MVKVFEKELSGLIPIRDTVVSVGVFDGMHLGHKTLIERLVSEAKAKKLLSAVITFKQHPSTLFSPGKPELSVTSLAERIRLLKALGVDIVVTLTFSRELAELGAQTFVLMLQRYLKMQGMILGWDFALGHHREGSLETLHELGKKLGFSTEVVGPVRLGDEIISSTAIRKALAAGEIGKVNAMLGRSFSLEGKVVTGEGRGTELLGFPTANLDLDSLQALPADGVYAAMAFFGEQTKPAAVFIGLRPTFNGVERIVEVQVLDFTGNLYRKSLRIDIIERLRGVVKFPDAESLKAQIEKDVAQVRQILAHN